MKSNCTSNYFFATLRSISQPQAITMRDRSNSTGTARLGESINDSSNSSPRMSGSPLALSPLSVGSPRAGSPRNSKGFMARKKSVEFDSNTFSCNTTNNGNNSNNNNNNNNNLSSVSSSLQDSKVKGNSITNSNSTSNDDLRKTMFKSCPENKCQYLATPRRASVINNPPSPLVPPLKLTQSISLNTVDPSSSTAPSFLSLLKTDSNESLCCDSSGGESDEDHSKRDDNISQIIRKLSISEEADEHLDIVMKGNKAMEARLKLLNRSRANSYVRDDELQCAGSDDYGIRSVLAVNEVLSSDIKTIQSLLDDKMILVRALFDVPEYGEYNNVALWVSTIYLAHEKTMHVIRWAIKQEVDAAESENALFRADSMCCALIANFVRLLGRSYLQKVIGPHILKMYQTSKSYEIDLNREKSAKSNATRLRKLAHALLKSVFKSIPHCPRIIRELLYQMRAAVRVKYPDSVALKTVSSFFFLRFVSPAILYPSSCGILEPLQRPSVTAQRGLVLAGKILQNLANGVDSELYPDAHMRSINKVLVKNSEPMHDFMEKLCKVEGPMVPISEECFPTQQQYKTSVHELQKYITEKIASIPKVQGPETEAVTRLIKLRRALQSYSNTWRNPGPTKLNPPPTPSHFTSCSGMSISASTSPPQSSMLSTSAGSCESNTSVLSLVS